MVVSALRAVGPLVGRGLSAERRKPSSPASLARVRFHLNVKCGLRCAMGVPVGMALGRMRWELGSDLHIEVI